MDSVDLYWLPLGAGGHVVRFCGDVYEAFAARAQQRAPCHLYHSALVVRLAGREWAIEMAPVFAAPPERCGVVATGAVGAAWAGRFDLLRYGIRRWPDGSIPDIAEAVDSPLRLTSDPVVARRMLELVPHVPTPVWGRDELRTGEMWSSNSVVAWLVARSEIDTGPIAPPHGGRAPGWSAGVAVAGGPAPRPMAGRPALTRTPVDGRAMGPENALRDRSHPVRGSVGRAGAS